MNTQHSQVLSSPMHVEISNICSIVHFQTCAAKVDGAWLSLAGGSGAREWLGMGGVGLWGGRFSNFVRLKVFCLILDSQHIPFKASNLYVLRIKSISDLSTKCVLSLSKQCECKKTCYEYLSSFQPENVSIWRIDKKCFALNSQAIAITKPKRQGRSLVCLQGLVLLPQPASNVSIYRWVLPDGVRAAPKEGTPREGTHSPKTSDLGLEVGLPVRF